MGRYKMGPQGGYYDPNDSGPDQFTPQAGQQYPGMPAPQQQPAQPSAPQSGGYLPPIDFPMPGQGQVYTGGYDPNGPMYGKPGWGGGAGEMPSQGKIPPITGDFAPGGAAWTGGNMQPGEVWNNGQATDQYTKESAPLGYFYPGSKYGDKDEYYKLHGGGGMSTGGSLSSLVGQQGFAKANGNLTANGSKWGGLGLGSLGSLAGFKK